MCTAVASINPFIKIFNFFFFPDVSIILYFIDNV